MNLHDNSCEKLWISEEAFASLGDLRKDGIVKYIPAIRLIGHKVAALFKSVEIRLKHWHVVIRHDHLEILERQLAVTAEWSIRFLELFSESPHKSLATFSYFAGESVDQWQGWLGSLKCRDEVYLGDLTT